MVLAATPPAVWAVFALIIYFAPSIVGGGRHVPNVGSIFVINLFLGWTLIGWVVALAMASRTVPTAPAPPKGSPR